MIPIRLFALLALLLMAPPSFAQGPSESPRFSAAPSALGLIGDAEAAIGAGDDKRAENLISRIPASSLDSLQLARVQIVRAEIGLKRRQPDTVLRSLPGNSSHVPMLSARIEQLRAGALFLTGDVAGAVRALVLRERALTTPAAIAENREQIWSGLVTTPLPASAIERIATEEPVTRGWLDLARVLQQGPSPAAISGWVQRNPGHPGQAKLALVRPGDATPAGPAPFAGTGPEPLALQGGYALLLPVSGPLASAGRAVRDGFVSAWFASSAPRAAVRVYDTGSDPAQAVAAYRDALRDGAGTLVGPLTREGITAVAAQLPTLRWLALNYAEEGANVTALQLGVSPEDEARAAAADAIAAGRLSALILSPANAWGDRAIAAFTQVFVEQGGSVLQVTRFNNGIQDFGRPLRDLLGLDASAQRHAALDRVLAEKTEFEPRPRDDADLLFAPLRTAEARVLVPQLDFFRVRELATYTVSTAHGGQVDRQLDGLLLCDMPWILESSGPAAAERDRLRDLFPEALRSQPRLFALGHDALRLVATRDPFAGGGEVEGATGRLALMPGNRVMRHLACRPIVDGRPASAP